MTYWSGTLSALWNHTFLLVEVFVRIKQTVEGIFITECFRFWRLQACLTFEGRKAVSPAFPVIASFLMDKPVSGFKKSPVALSMRGRKCKNPKMFRYCLKVLQMVDNYSLAQNETQAMFNYTNSANSELLINKFQTGWNSPWHADY